MKTGITSQGRGLGRGRGSGQGSGGATSLWQWVAPLAKDFIRRHEAKPYEEKAGLEQEIALLGEEINAMNRRLSKTESQGEALQSELDSIKKRLAKIETGSGPKGCPK
jgi:hypothetical protein